MLRNLQSVLYIFLIAFIMHITVPVQGSSDNVMQLFHSHEVVPDVIATAPNKLLKITYNNEISVTPGMELTPTQVQHQPQVMWQAEPDAFYTLIMTDPDAPSRAEPKFREFRHWLVANIPGNDIASGDAIAAYLGSGPPQGTGLHRYVFLLYKQPAKLEITENRVGNNSRQDRPKFRAANFVEKYNLGLPIAGNFFQAQWDDHVPLLQKQLAGN